MDISNEASVDPFSIGPSTIVGRTVAFRILFCKSISHLRHQILRVLWSFIYTFRDFVAPMAAWLHPRNPQGILAMVTIIAFLLKRYTNVKQRAEMAYRRKFWRNMMRAALTYEEWAHAAKMLDKETPKMNESDLYDVELVRNKLQELHHRRQERSLKDIIFCMRADLIRNLGNMCNPELHKGRLQVPKLIKEYIDEVSTQLRVICDSDSEELTLEEKLAFMHETRHAFGRTALLLSGGASLGTFHVGVVRTLVEHKLLPRIIAGSSVGSIMCAVVATKSWPELQSFFEDSLHSMQFFDQMGGIFTVVKRVMTQGAVHEIRKLQMMLRHLTSNLTFQEAYDMTGRILGITVCSPRKHEPPRCLNYLTSPHVVIWSAVTASCAFPGLFEAQELMAKDRSGEIVPYHPPFNLGPEEASGTHVRRWRDGSLEIDLPMMQLKELFNVNHFIVSQANPHVAPLLRMKEFVRAYGGNFAAKLAHLAEMEVKHRYNQILELGFPLGGLAKLFAQDWEGDITIVMPATLAQYSKIIQNPSYVELQKAANQGRRCTWEKLSAIKANCGIELALDECVAILNHMRRLKRSAERAAASSHGLASTVRFSASRRIPSWNQIARENSTGSLEDLLADVAPSFHQGVGGSTGGGPSGKNLRTHRNMHDGSDSESESVDLNSWTRSGGPLMRTTSAEKFIHFVQNLDIDVEENRGLIANANSITLHIVGNNQCYRSPRVNTPDRSSEGTESDQRDLANIVSTNGSSITVTEGDLLQPESTHNGIVFNIVKREDLTIPPRSHDAESYSSDVPECLHLDCLEKEIDTSSTSEYGDENVTPTNSLDLPVSTSRDPPGIRHVQPENPKILPLPNFQILKPHRSCRARAHKSSMSLFSPSVRLSLILCSLGLLFGSHFGHALKLPFRVKDVLPALPHQISWPVLNNFHSAVDLLPSFVGSVSPYNGTIEWKGSCFDGNEARLEFTEGDREEQLGGGVLYLKTSAAHSWTCMDLYVFATPYRITWDYYFSAREHTLKFNSWEEHAELEYVKQHGISVFLMPSGMLGTLLSLVDVLPLFSNTAWGQNANIAFLKNHMSASFEKRPQPWRATINPDDVHSGDFLAVSKIRGRWGGFETLEKWVTGAFAGHTAVCLKDEMGNLWVGESGHENEEGEEIIVVIPWDEWWELALKDSSNPQIALLPLHPELRAKFNSTAAWEYARSMAGKPYGYHNMIFSWIDTVSDNYPPPLDAHLVISVMSMWTRMQPAYAANMWNEALNKRLGTEDLDLYEILAETEKRGIAFDQLLTIPEQDEWVYSDGKSTTCVAFILAMYKEAGIFGPTSNSIQVTEFTIRDAYMLKIFEDNQTRLPSWCNNEGGRLPFCQVLGEYWMELPQYNTLEPYTNMNENCPSLPPIYDRPIRC